MTSTPGPVSRPAGPNTTKLGYVDESDVDLILVLDAHRRGSLIELLLIEAGLEAPPTRRATRSALRNNGTRETDVEVSWNGGVLFIEDKIDSGFTPGQPHSYAEEVTARIVAGDTAAAVLVCPQRSLERYRAGGGDAFTYVTCEQLAGRAEQAGDRPRASSVERLPLAATQTRGRGREPEPVGGGPAYRAAMAACDVDVDELAAAYLGERSATARYASFDYCFNYFGSFHDAGRLGELAAPEHLQTSCLQLGFYLASWGMFRGKAELLTHSAKRLAPAVAAIASAPDAVWSIDADDYGPEAQRTLFEVAGSLRSALPGGKSATLVTKAMLGVFGCVPAYDRFFRLGSCASTFGPKSLRNLEAFCRANDDAIAAHRVPTLDFTTGAPTDRRYTRAKVLDMVFFTAGLRRSLRRSATAGDEAAG